MHTPLSRGKTVGFAFLLLSAKRKNSPIQDFAAGLPGAAATALPPPPPRKNDIQGQDGPTSHVTFSINPPLQSSECRSVLRVPCSHPGKAAPSKPPVAGAADVRPCSDYGSERSRKLVFPDITSTALSSPSQARLGNKVLPGATADVHASAPFSEAASSSSLQVQLVPGARKLN